MLSKTHLSFLPKTTLIMFPTLSDTLYECFGQSVRDCRTTINDSLLD